MISNVFLLKGRQFLSQMDWWLVGSVFFLICLGLVIQYSIGFSDEALSRNVFSKQLFYALVSGALFFLFSSIDHRVTKIPAIISLGISILLLLAVLLFGTTIQGTKGWFVVGPFSFQPVEFVKLFFILFLASTFEEGIISRYRIQHFVITAMATAVIIILILLQPDIGSSLIIFLLWFVMLIVLKARLWMVGSVVVTVIAASFIGWFFLFEDYQKERLTSFFSPSSDPFGSGYQLTQSVVAVGSGNFWGRGLGLGTQSQLHFLPQATSDFIFAVIAEELGFIGITFVLAALVILLWRITNYLLRIRDAHAFLLILGIFCYLLIQSVFVIGMNMGMMPITGLPLPLVSAGGSSLVMTMILLGIAHHIGISADLSQDRSGKKSKGNL